MNPMIADRRKGCPVCRALAPIDAAVCAGCGHAYRTRFAATPPAPAAPPSLAPVPMLGVLPAPDLPLPPESRLLMGGPTPPAPVAVPLVPAPRVVTHLPDPRSVSSSLDNSPSYAAVDRRLPWIKALVAFYVLYRIVSFLVHFRHALK